MFAVKRLFIFIFVTYLIVGLSACSEDDVADLLGIKIDADNAADVTHSALDMAEAGNLAEDVTDGIQGAGPTINETVDCADPLIGATNASGSATVTGTISGDNKDLTLTYNNCTMDGYSLNGSFNIVSSVAGDIKTKTITGNLTVGYQGQSFSIKNYSKVDTRNQVTEDYSEDFGMTINLPIIGDINIDTTVPFSGNKLNSPDKPVTGEMVVVGTSNTKTKLTVIDNSTGYNIDLDSDGDGVYDTQITNPDNGTLVFPW